jgi:acetyl-CoA carboxylase beta subunit
VSDAENAAVTGVLMKVAAWKTGRQVAKGVYEACLFLSLSHSPGVRWQKSVLGLMIYYALLCLYSLFFLVRPFWLGI